MNEERHERHGRRVARSFTALAIVLLAGESLGACANGGHPATWRDAAVDARADSAPDAASEVVGDVATSLDVDASDTAATDTAADDTTSLDVDASDTADDATVGDAFACGASGLTCRPGQACESMGQGVCGGPPPPCGPDCYATDCGGGTHCLCDSFSCVDLPAGCTSCKGCQLPPEYSFCACDDSSDHVTLSCPGA